MKITRTTIPDVVILEPSVYEDERGWFMETFNEQQFHQELQNLGLPTPSRFVQDNYSCSKKGVLRGLHYQQSPHAQGKLVRVVQGAAYDVAVDIRVGSPTFGYSIGIELSAVNKRSVWIPEGFAHGFVALEEDTRFIYKTTDFYSKECEASIRWNDPSIGINWPLGDELLLNEKDKVAPLLKDAQLMPNINFSFERGKLIDLNVIGDERGSLIALEQGIDIPFDIKRVYYIFDTQLGVSRGFHAHKKLEQFVVCVAGKCRIVLDDGKNRETIWLDSPGKGLRICSMIWREMHDFSADCVLMVLASDTYDERDYIRSYHKFVEFLNNA